MPCNAAPSPEFSSEDLDAVEIYMQTQVDRVTRVACEAFKILRLNGLFDALGEEAKAWSLEHDAWDAARELLERSVKVVVRKPHFDKNGDELWDGPCDDDITQLRIHALGEGKAVDQELSRAVYEQIVGEFEDDEYNPENDIEPEESDHGIEVPKDE